MVFDMLFLWPNGITRVTLFILSILATLKHLDSVYSFSMSHTELSMCGVAKEVKIKRVTRIIKHELSENYLKLTSTQFTFSKCKIIQKKMWMAK